MAIKRWFLACALVSLVSVAEAQSVEVNRQNRTIELTVQNSVEVEADMATITVGYHNWGPTHDVAYQENMRFADQILKAWTDAGVSQKDISTQELSSDHVQDDELNAMDPSERKQRQYEAMQSWKIVATPDVAQKLLDIAVSAGANYVGDPQWELSDPNAAEAKAYSAALEQAHTIADQMAKSFGAKVGSLLYATNQTRVATQLSFLGSSTLNTSTASVGTRKWPPLHPVKLLPQQLEKSATVRAIFALE